MAFYRKNIGGLHQAVRVIAGTAMGVGAMVWLAAPASYVSIGVGAAIILSGLFGYCPMCAVAGVGRDRS